MTDEAENGLKCIKLLKAGKQLDIILLDIEMPELNGGETLDITKKDFPSIKTIMLSMFDDEELIKDYFNRGACAYLPKNSNAEIMVDAIRIVNSIGIYKENIPSLLNIDEIHEKGECNKVTYSRREREIINLLCKGNSVSEVAIELSISEKTIETHLTEIYKKAKVSNRYEFLIYAIKEGLNFLSKI